MRRIEPLDEERKGEAEFIDLRCAPLPAQIDPLWSAASVPGHHRIPKAMGSRAGREIRQGPRAALAVGHDLRFACRTGNVAPRVVVGARRSCRCQYLEVAARTDSHQGI